MMGALLLLLLLASSGAMGKSFSYLDILEEDPDSSEAGDKRGAATTNCTCGQTNKARVVGGRETQKNEFPLMAGIYAIEDKRVFCGATILTVWHALTASHCIISYQWSPIALAVGEHDITTMNETHSELIPIRRAIEHERYNIDTLENDIAMLELRFPIKFSDIIGPACLPTKIMNLEHEFVKVLGWGLTEDNGYQAKRLQKANLRVIKLEECAKAIKGVNVTKATQICTWMKNRDSCDGDSGGPLLWLDPQSNRFTVVGIVSYGSVCASEVPAVYTNVASYLNWIQAKIAASGKDVQTCAKVY